MDEVEYLPAAHGWLAVHHRYPRYAGYGPSQEAAADELRRTIAAYLRSLARAAFSAPGQPAAGDLER